MGSWHDVSHVDKEILIVCPVGPHGETFNADRCAVLMIEADEMLRTSGKEPRFYGYGDLVTDPLAVVRRFLHFRGHRIVPGSLNRMTCPEHRKDDDERAR